MPTVSAPELDVPATERLFERYRPRRYELRLEIDPDKDEFSGRVAVELELMRPADRIVLHAAELRVLEARINGRPLAASSIEIRAAEETVILSPGSELAAGPAKVELSYAAPFNRQMRGLYIARARFEGREERHAFTQFEPASARKMLPCIDEPEAKAVFDVTVTSPERWTVLGNTPALRREVRGGLQTVRFKPSPKMSTYLLAVAVARLASKSAKVGKTTVRVWTLPDRLKQGDFALKAAVYSLSWLNRYFAIPYPLEKLDLVAVPEFSAGAMENWGLITFRDMALLVDPKLSSGHAYRRVAAVIAHEIVHQWFGNLVTMRWWNDLWLNEAFATWLAFKVIDEWKPRWGMWRSYEERKATAMPVDALKNTRAISSEVRSIGDIEAQFDALTYQKGGAVLRMIESYIGEKAFRDGVRAYMRRYAYGNTEAKDLWSAIERASKEPVTRLAEDWLARPGFPVVSFDGRALSQRRFSAYGPSPDDALWTTPVVLRYKRAGESRVRASRVLLQGREMSLKLEGRGALDWLYTNSGETGFYRVSLEPGLRAALARRGRTALTAEERSGFVSSSWALARNGSMSHEELLEVLRGLKGETEWIALDAVRACLCVLHDRVADSVGRRRELRELGLEIAGPLAARLGWGPLSDENKRLARASAFGILAALSPDDGFLKKARAALERYLKEPSRVDPGLASVVLDLGARTTPGRFDAYVRLLESAKTPDQRDLLLKALAEFREPGTARRALDLTLTDRVLGQDIWKPLGFALGNTAVQKETWGFVRANWGAIRGKAGRSAARLIDALSGYWDLEARREAEAFFSDPANRIPSADRSLRQTLELMELGASFARRARG